MSDAAELVDFISAAGQERSLRVEEDLGGGYVRLRVSEAERRQARHDIRCVEDAVIELLRNARDAGARHVYLATSKDGDVRTLVVLDDGRGIPKGLRERIFDARVTSKLDSVHVDRWGVHGRGMALFSVRENALSAEVMASAPGAGSSIRVVVDTGNLAERTDQSTWPTMGEDGEDGHTIVRGPHNIIRCCAEFVLDERGRVDVWLGSAADIVATIREQTRVHLDASELLFVDDVNELGVLERIPVAADASELLVAARSVGLEMSERTAHRILSGQIRPVRSVFSRLSRWGGGHGKTRRSEVDLMREQRRLRVSSDDAQRFSRIMERDFAFLAERYYLTLSDAPTVRATSEKVVVTFHVSQGD